MLLSTHAGAMRACERSSDMFISRLLSLAINIITVHEEKKHGILPRNSVVLYHGSFRGIILRKLWYYTLNSWYYPSALPP